MPGFPLEGRVLFELTRVVRINPNLKLHPKNG